MSPRSTPPRSRPKDSRNDSALSRSPPLMNALSPRPPRGPGAAGTGSSERGAVGAHQPRPRRLADSPAGHEDEIPCRTAGGCDGTAPEDGVSHGTAAPRLPPCGLRPLPAAAGRTSPRHRRRRRGAGTKRRATRTTSPRGSRPTAGPGRCGAVFPHPQAPGPRQRAPGPHRQAPGGARRGRPCRQADSLRRPRRRRRARTARPPGVLIRARKPCFRFLLRFLG